MLSERVKRQASLCNTVNTFRSVWSRVIDTSAENLGWREIHVKESVQNCVHVRGCDDVTKRASERVDATSRDSARARRGLRLDCVIREQTTVRVYYLFRETSSSRRTRESSSADADGKARSNDCPIGVNRRDRACVVANVVSLEKVEAT